jgi:energy-coupling factor transporter transmembrane protein EcfT
MRNGIALGGYVPTQSALHRLHPALKAALLVLYVGIVAVCSAAVGLLAIGALLALVTWAAHLPLRYAGFMVTTGCLLGAIAAGLPVPMPLANVIAGLGRVACLVLLVSLFSMTTRANDLLPIGGRGWRASAAFAVSLTVAMLPGIQYDLQRAVDTATLRRGRPVRPLNLGVWLGLLPHAILRGLARADRLAEAIVDRGWGSGEVFTRLQSTAMRPADVLLALVAAVPAIALLVVRP